MPKVINKDEASGPIKTYTEIYRAGFVLNAVFPITEGIVWVISYKDVFINKDDDPPKWMSRVGAAASIGVGVMQIISGTILIWAVLSIRSYLNSHVTEGQQINVCMLLLHASAFGLFLVSIFLNTVIEAS